MTVRPWFALAAGLWLAAPAPAQPMLGGANEDLPKYALIVGVNDYANRNEGLKPLAYAERDAHVLAELLKSQGYEVALLTVKAAAEASDPGLKPTSTNIEARLDDLLGPKGRPGEGRAKKGHTVLIALAGHGFRLDQDPEHRDFFAPANAIPKITALDTLVSINGVIERLEKSPAAARMLLVDACRNTIDADGKETKTAKPDLNPKVADGVCVLLSCKGGQKSFEDDDLQHGVFSHFVLSALSTFGDAMTWDVMSKQVCDNVPKKATLGDQNPIDLSALNTNYPVILRLKEPVRLVAPFAPEKAQEYQRVWAKHLKLLDDKAEVAVELSRDPAKKVPLQMVIVPPGEFEMGAAVKGGGKPGETPHKVTLTKHYFMGKTEITQKQMDLILGKKHPNTFAAGGRLAKDVADVVTDDFPADSVRYSDAEKFCELMTKLLKTSDGPFENYVCRLPTEAEWEYACRAGTQTKFHLGNTIKAGAANCLTPPVELKRTERVGQYQKNAFGLGDMHGNVEEWCSDWFQPSGTDAVTNPTGPKVGRQKVLRGGNYNSEPDDCRTAARVGGKIQGDALPIWGFRVVFAPQK